MTRSQSDLSSSPRRRFTPLVASMLCGRRRASGSRDRRRRRATLPRSGTTRSRIERSPRNPTRCAGCRSRSSALGRVHAAERGRRHSTRRRGQHPRRAARTTTVHLAQHVVVDFTLAPAEPFGGAHGSHRGRGVRHCRGLGRRRTNRDLRRLLRRIRVVGEVLKSFRPTCRSGDGHTPRPSRSALRVLRSPNR